MANEAKVVIKGDAADLIKNAKTGQTEIEKIGKKGASAAQEFQRLGHHLGRSVLHALALKAAIEGSFKAMRDLQTESAKANRDVGKNVVSRDLAAAKLGLSPAEAAAIAGGSSPRTQEELTGFLGQLASGDNAKFLSKQEKIRAAAAFSSGLFEENEVIEAAKKGGINQLLAESGTRAASLSSDGAAELQARREENALKNRADEANAGRGLGNRLAEARIAARNAEHPVAGAVQGILKSGTSIVGGEAIVDAIDTSLNNQTQTLIRESKRPVAAPAAE